jgi:hypothetical protein
VVCPLTLAGTVCGPWQAAVRTIGLASAIGRTRRGELHTAETGLAVGSRAALGIVLSDVVIVNTRDGVPTRRDTQHADR